MGQDFIDFIQGERMSSFGYILFRLIDKADHNQLAKINTIFPAHVALYLWFHKQKRIPEKDIVIRVANRFIFESKKENA